MAASSALETWPYALNHGERLRVAGSCMYEVVMKTRIEPGSLLRRIGMGSGDTIAQGFPQWWWLIFGNQHQARC